jgi:hypothetical protein
MFGVSISPPYGLIAEYPTLSSTMYSTFGVPSGAIGCVYGSQSGTACVTSTLITPRNGFAITAPHAKATSLTWSLWQQTPQVASPVRSEGAGDHADAWVPEADCPGGRRATWPPDDAAVGRLCPQGVGGRAGPKIPRIKRRSPVPGCLTPEG